MLAAALASATGVSAARALPATLTRLGPWLIALAIGLGGWELITAKLDLLPRPFFAAPQSMLEVLTDDWPRLGESLLRSLWLLIPAYLLGAAAGFLTGVAVGWSRRVGYWVHPVLATDRPGAGGGVDPDRLLRVPKQPQRQHLPDRAGDLLPGGGADLVGRRLRQCCVLRRGPHHGRAALVPGAPGRGSGGDAVGVHRLFMGLGASFSVLVVAEMLGVKAGLGWYMQWAQGWAAYANMYVALGVMALMCTALITLLFRVRDHFLSWQKGLVRW